MKLAIVEDDPLLRENLKMLLGGEPGITIVGVYPSAEAVLDGIGNSQADVVLCDLGLPGMSGVELIRRMKTDFPTLEIMAHTVFDDKENVFSAIRAGASGYLLKGISPREIVEAIYTLHKGGSPMSPKIARKVIREFHDVEPGGQYLLSQREKEILNRAEDGLTYQEIATALNIGVHSVHAHIKRIYEKLQAKDRPEALIKA